MYRMRELQGPGVEVMCVDTQPTGAVGSIADDGVVECMHMQSYLMGATRVWPSEHCTCPICVSTDDTKVRFH